MLKSSSDNRTIKETGFTGPSVFLSVNVRGPVYFAVSVAILATAPCLRTIYTRHGGFPCNADAPVPPFQLINFWEKIIPSVGYHLFVLSHSLWVIFVKFSYIATLLGSFLWNFDTPVGVIIHPADIRLGWKFTLRTPHPVLWITGCPVNKCVRYSVGRSNMTHMIKQKTSKFCGNN